MSAIRQRLTQRLLWGWSLLLLLGGLVAYGIAHTALTHQFDEALYAKALALSSAVEQERGRITMDFSDQLVREFNSTNRTALFQVWTADGAMITNSASLGGTVVPLRHGAAQSPQYWNLKLSEGTTARAISLRFKPAPADESGEGNPLAEAIAVVAVNRRELDAALKTLALVLTGSSLLVLALTALTVPRLLQRELAPLNRLAEQAQQITAASLTERFPTDGLPAELAPIGARLNDLLQRLQTAFKRERQFSDDLAHEFRTPISELRSLAELSLKWPDTRNKETDQGVLAIALQMESMINRLLAIARSGRDPTLFALERVELAPLVSAAYHPLQARAAVRQLSLRMSVPAGTAVRSDPVLLRSILANLLDNAVEHSAPNGAVQIQSETHNGQFRLHVTNPVQQLAADDVPHLFERFWRKDTARSGNEHSGLGLALARALATNLGYTLTASLQGNSLLTMTLSGATNLEPSGQH